MSQLHIAPDLALPVDAVTETIAVLGIRGSGKSTTAAVLVEELLAAGQQVLIVDPTDVWWGAKSSADGKAAGFPIVVLGGKHADLPLAAGDGATIADFVIDNPVSIICSMRQFESKADQRRFVTDLARRLYYRKGQQEHPRPLMVVIDEASLFVPQRVMGDEAKMVGAIQQLVRQGRSSGFGVTLIDQRAASVNKDVLTQLEVLVCHRTISPQDRKALDEWIRAHDTEGQRDQFLADLASLPRATAYVWSPGWLNVFQRVKIRAPRTFDSRRTPKAGERTITPRETAAVDLDALKSQLGTSIEKARAEDPKALQQRIRELERRLLAAEKGKGVIAAAEVAQRIQAAKDEAIQRERERADQEMRSIVSRVGKAVGILRDISVPDREPITRPSSVAPMPPVVRPLAERVAPTASRSNGGSTRDAIGGTPQRMLDALAFYATIDVPHVSRSMLAGYVGISANTGSFRTYLSQLRTAGFIQDLPDGGVRLTPEGHAAARPPDVAPRLADLHAHWMGKLGGTPGRMLNVLIESYPNAISRADLAGAVGIDHGTGSFRTYLSQLRTPGLIADVSREVVVASDLLFPPGLV